MYREKIAMMWDTPSHTCCNRYQGERCIRIFTIQVVIIAIFAYGRYKRYVSVMTCMCQEGILLATYSPTTAPMISPNTPVRDMYRYYSKKSETPFQ
jgi:hypothetical protein